MQRIKIGHFKLRIEKAIDKKLHNTAYARYRAMMLAPNNKVRAKYLILDVESTIKEIVKYEDMSHSDKIKFGNLRKEEAEKARKWCLFKR